MGAALRASARQPGCRRQRPLRDDFRKRRTGPAEHHLDRLPAAPQVSIAAGFSGHGYKFCSLVGEVMADLAIDGATGHDIGLFGLARFAG